MSERRRRAVKNVLDEEFAVRQRFLRQVRSALQDKLGDDDWARVPLRDLEGWIGDKEITDPELAAESVIAHLEGGLTVSRRRTLPQTALDEIAAGALVADGPLVEVEFRAPCPPRPGRPVLCPPVRGPALLDTGANRSAFSLPDIARTGAQPSGVTGVQGVTGSGSTLPQYPGVVSLPGSDLEPTKLDYVVATPHIRDQDIIGVLGRDYLKDKSLAYDGRTGRFVLQSVEGSVDRTATSSGPFWGVVAAGAMGVALAVLWPKS